MFFQEQPFSARFVGRDRAAKGQAAQRPPGSSAAAGQLPSGQGYSCQCFLYAGKGKTVSKALRIISFHERVSLV
jgi:hypothetical protein